MNGDELYRLYRRVAHLEQVCRLYQDAVDKAFHGKDAILPNFVPLGGSKIEAIVKLALAYKAELGNHAREGTK